MIQKKNFVVIGLACALLAQSLTASPLRRNERGRVAGLAVTILDQIANGTGKDVEIQVDMTTVERNYPTVMMQPLRGLFGGSSIFQAFTESEIQSNRSGFGGLGDADLRFTSSVSDSAGRQFTGFYYQTATFMPPTFAREDSALAPFGMFYSGVALEATFQGRSFIEGELPALDFGDGNIVPVTSLSSTGSPTTTTDGPVENVYRRWRGTFVHTYADQGSYVVTAASRCCPQIVPGDDDETERGFFNYVASPGNVVSANNPELLQFAYTQTERVSFRSGYNTPGPFNQNTRGGEGGMTGVLTSSFQDSGTGVVGRAAQVTNTALIEEGVGAAFAIGIPTAGTYGLGLLSLLLAAAGFVALRR